MNPLALDTRIRDKYGPAMEITTQEEADAYFEECVDHCLRCDQQEGGVKTRAEAEELERSNLGYYAGYYSHETRERVERLFRCWHPIFGAIAENGPPTAEQSFAMIKNALERELT